MTYSRPPLTERGSAVPPKIIGISIVNYFSHSSVKLLLESLQVFATGSTVYVSIVDNSQDQEREELENLRRTASLFANSGLVIEVIAAEANLGYGAGNNVGINHLIQAGATLLWVLNPDTVVRGSASGLASEVAKSRAALWSTVTREHGVTSNGLGELSTLTGKASASLCLKISVERFKMQYPGGHSMLFTVDAWQALKGFDEDYFLFMEEADLTLRSQRLSIETGTLASVTVHHDQGLTTGSTEDVRLKSLVAFSEATRSRIIFFRKFYPRRLPLMLVIRVAYMASVAIRGNLAGAKAIYEGVYNGLAIKQRGKG